MYVSPPGSQKSPVEMPHHRIADEDRVPRDRQADQQRPNPALTRQDGRRRVRPARWPLGGGGSVLEHRDSHGRCRVAPRSGATERYKTPIQRGDMGARVAFRARALPCRPYDGPGPAMFASTCPARRQSAAPSATCRGRPRSPPHRPPPAFRFPVHRDAGVARGSTWLRSGWSGAVRLGQRHPATCESCRGWSWPRRCPSSALPSSLRWRVPTRA